MSFSDEYIVIIKKEINNIKSAIEKKISMMNPK